MKKSAFEHLDSLGSPVLLAVSAPGVDYLARAFPHLQETDQCRCEKIYRGYVPCYTVLLMRETGPLLITGCDVCNVSRVAPAITALLQHGSKSNGVTIMGQMI